MILTCAQHCVMSWRVGAGSSSTAGSSSARGRPAPDRGVGRERGARHTRKRGRACGAVRGARRRPGSAPRPAGVWIGARGIRCARRCARLAAMRRRAARRSWRCAPPRVHALLLLLLLLLMLAAAPLLLLAILGSASPFAALLGPTLSRRWVSWPAEGNTVSSSRPSVGTGATAAHRDVVLDTRCGVQVGYSRERLFMTSKAADVVLTDSEATARGSSRVRLSAGAKSGVVAGISRVESDLGNCDESSYDLRTAADCGFDGIRAEDCLAVGCYWRGEDTEGLPSGRMQQESTGRRGHEGQHKLQTRSMMATSGAATAGTLKILTSLAARMLGSIRQAAAKAARALVGAREKGYPRCYAPSVRGVSAMDMKESEADVPVHGICQMPHEPHANASARVLAPGIGYGFAALATARRMDCGSPEQGFNARQCKRRSCCWNSEDLPASESPMDTSTTPRCTFLQPSIKLTSAEQTAWYGWDGQTWSPERPLFSIIVPCYAQERFVRDAVASVFAQSFVAWELIVVDDHSPPVPSNGVMLPRNKAPADGRPSKATCADVAQGAIDDFSFTLETKASSARARYGCDEHSGCPHYQHRIVIERSASNVGLAATRNRAIFELARAPYVLPLDADDVLAPDFLARVALGLRATHGRAQLLYADQATFGDDPAVGSVWFLAPNMTLSYAAQRGPFPVTTVFSRGVFEAAGGYPLDMIFGNEDYSLWLTMLARGVQTHKVGGLSSWYRVKRSGAMSRSRAYVDLALPMLRSKHPWLFAGGARGGLREVVRASGHFFCMVPADRAIRARLIQATQMQPKVCTSWYWFALHVLRWGHNLRDSEGEGAHDIGRSSQALQEGAGDDSDRVVNATDASVNSVAATTAIVRAGLRACSVSSNEPDADTRSARAHLQLLLGALTAPSAVANALVPLARARRLASACASGSSNIVQETEGRQTDPAKPSVDPYSAATRPCDECVTIAAAFSAAVQFDAHGDGLISHDSQVLNAVNADVGVSTRVRAAAEQALCNAMLSSE